MLIFSCKYYLWLKFSCKWQSQMMFLTNGNFYCIRINISKLLWNQMCSFTFNCKSWFLMLCYVHVNIFLDNVKHFIKVWLTTNIFFTLKQYYHLHIFPIYHAFVVEKVDQNWLFNTLAMKRGTFIICAFIILKII
jgi:hypothetical protein